MSLLTNIKNKKQNKISAFIIKHKLDIIVILSIIIFSLILNLYNIRNYGYGNEYYAAAIHSMTKNFNNFFFCSFDPSGLLSVDKAPLGLWIQVLFVSILGYNGLALILPQIICSTLSSLLIYIMVKHYTNNLSAILSSFFFTLTPIIIATSRNNTIDMQLIFVLLLSLMFFFKFMENYKIKYILLSAILIGLGFNIKMLQAYIILPAMFIIYIIFCKLPRIKKILYCILSTTLILIISLLWPYIVSLTAPDSRPYIDSTSNNSAFELIVKHNGIFRLIGYENLDNSQIVSSSNMNDNNNNPDLYQYNDYIGKCSIFRLFYQSIYGQVSWLIVFSFTFIVIFFKRIKIYSEKPKIFNSFFSIYFIFMLLLFSFIGFFHRYYLCMIAPAISILSGECIVILLDYFKSKSNYEKYIFPVCFLLTMILEIVNVKKFPTCPAILLFFMIFLFCFTIILIIINIKSHNGTIYKIISSLSILTMLCAPFYWCITTLIYVPNVTKPSAGPEIANNSINMKTINGGITTVKYNLDLEKYLLDNYKKGSFLVASAKSNNVAEFIIKTSLPVLCTNGFTGDINYISIDTFKELVGNGQIRYFLIYDNDDVQNDITDYVKNNATIVPSDAYNSLSPLNNIKNFDSNSLQKKYAFKLYYFNN